MAEPRIQYAQTADGVSIAFWTRGDGEALVHMPAVPWTGSGFPLPSGSVIQQN